jgi:hypothetical protein
MEASMTRTKAFKQPYGDALAIKRKNKTIEHNLQKAIVKYLEFNGFLVIRHNSGAVKTGKYYVKNYVIENTKSSAGLSDLQILKNGKVAFLEIKKNEKLQLTKSQSETKRIFNSYGIIYEKIGSINDFEEFLKEFNKDLSNV